MTDQTNEEKRVAVYTTHDTPTVPATVTPNTPLESLNLNWRERDLPEHQRTRHVHRLHPYPGKFIPQLAEIFLRKFFQPGQTLYDPFAGSGTTLIQASELLTYRSLIDTGAYQYKDLLKIILSCSARSARLTTHFDLDFPKKPQTEPYECYKHGRICEPTQEAFKFIKRYSQDTIERIREFDALRTGATVDVFHGDSRTIDLPPIDGVVTSPPYVGLIDYHEQHVYAYHLLGLEAKRDAEIGPAARGSSKKARADYQQAIVEVFQNCLKAMPLGGHLIVVAGISTAYMAIVPNAWK